MSYFSLPILLLSMLSILSRTSPSYGANYLYHFCANTTIPKNSPYKASLSSLFSSFSLYANHNVEFYSPSSSSLTSSLSSNAISKIQISLNISDPVYGLHICRGDVTAEVCRECVEEAANDLANRCSSELVAVIWYDECMMRYSNASFFSTATIRPRVALLNTQNMTKQEQFNRQVNMTMTDLASRASNVTAGAKKFGVNQVKISEFQTLYSLVQCTPDLSNTDCNSCLQAAINRLPICCGGKQGGRVLFPSCHVRYELYRFYNLVDTVPTPELPPRPLSIPPGSPSLPIGKVKHHFIAFHCW
ncbi:cysteine-rich receptor-like protein kinase 25 [Quercus robur]|uniref:cysteine-rich receptor-like protein kinase 25 n=1 Tax=Quercus robur TaxID=38942 RepID=UPI002163347C|nr:cysteine-rich receptor-like protein kinase 25 [Quercus robur]